MTTTLNTILFRTTPRFVQLLLHSFRLLFTTLRADTDTLQLLRQLYELLLVQAPARMQLASVEVCESRQQKRPLF